MHVSEICTLPSWNFAPSSGNSYHEILHVASTFRFSFLLRSSISNVCWYPWFPYAWSATHQMEICTSQRLVHWKFHPRSDWNVGNLFLQGHSCRKCVFPVSHLMEIPSAYRRKSFAVTLYWFFIIATSLNNNLYLLRYSDFANVLMTLECRKYEHTMCHAWRLVVIFTFRLWIMNWTWLISIVSITRQQCNAVWKKYILFRHLEYIFSIVFSSNAFLSFCTRTYARLDFRSPQCIMHNASLFHVSCSLIPKYRPMIFSNSFSLDIATHVDY